MHTFVEPGIQRNLGWIAMMAVLVAALSLFISQRWTESVAPTVPIATQYANRTGASSRLARPAASVPPSIPEYTAKAHALLLFSRYVEWPAGRFSSANDPLIIGVVGINPFGEVLERIVRKQYSQNRLIAVRHVGSVEEAAACHIVFLSRQGARQQQAWLTNLSELPVLTVAETEEALTQGAIVAFALQPAAKGSNLRYDIGLPAMQRAGLRIGPAMLKAARTVRLNRQEED